MRLARWATATLAVALAAGYLAAADDPDLERLDGEYGLWVEVLDDSLRVHWITRTPAAGFLRVVAGDELLFATTTPRDSVHVAAFRRPSADRVELQYGGLDSDDAHRTALRLDGERRNPPLHDAVDSLYVVGDVHGQFDTLVELLRNAGLVGDDLSWTGGGAHLVFLGDLLDRGADATRLLWFIYGLEDQAARAGGRVHVVLGNHEIMVLVGDGRYVAPKELRLARMHGAPYHRVLDVRRSILGRWLATKPGVMRIGDVLLAHGGVVPTLPFRTLRAFDDSLAKFMREDLFYHWTDSTVTIPIDSASLDRRFTFFWADDSAFWFRDYVRSDSLAEPLQRALRRYDARLHVVAHTTVPTVQERYGGRLIAVQPDATATELLLLVREGKGIRRYKIGLEGGAEALSAAAGP